MMLRSIYIVFLGILLSLFVGVGIGAFYSPPPIPVTAVISVPVAPQNGKRAIDNQKRLQNEYLDYQAKERIYTRNVSIIALSIAIIYLIMSLIILNNMVIFSDGFLFGSLFTLLYSIFRGFGSDDSKYQFAVVTSSLLIAIVVGYIKFIKATTKQNKP